MSISRLLLSRPCLSHCHSPPAGTLQSSRGRITFLMMCDHNATVTQGQGRPVERNPFSSWVCENTCNIPHQRKCIRGEAVPERRDNRNKAGQGRKKGRQTCASAWICRNVEGAEAVDVTCGKRLLFIVSHPSPFKHWRVLSLKGWTGARAVNPQPWNFIPSQASDGDPHQHAAQTAVKASWGTLDLYLLVLFICYVFIYLFICLHGCNGRAHRVVKEIQIPKIRRRCSWTEKKKIHL